MKALCFVVGALLAVTPAATGMGSGEPGAVTGHVGIVQAVPGATVGVSIDGASAEEGVAAGDVLGPYPLSPGRHRIDFTGPDVSVQTTIGVGPGSDQDVVLHRPAAVGGAAVVNSYRTPVDPIGPGKSRVLVAHTATVAPADVQVDGTVVFDNIANGEFATADVPAGHHVVALFPTGETTHPILGPLDVDLTAGTITMVYAVGNPEDSSMDLVVHSALLAADGSVVPAAIDTGSAGFAAWLTVTPFGPGARVPSS